MDATGGRRDHGQASGRAATLFVDPDATRWSVAALGLALALAVTVSPRTGHAGGGLLHLSLSTGLALGVVLVGASLARSTVATRRIRAAVLWTVGGALVLAAAGAWTLGMHPVSADAARDVVGFTLSAGGLAGSLVGTMASRSHERAAQVAEERERLSFLNYLLRHNVLNGVQVVTGQTQLLREDVPDHAHDRVDVIESWTAGLGTLVGRMRQILDARTGDTDLEPVPLGDVLATEAAKVEGAFDARITTAGSEPTVQADAGLHQVFECLLVDAVERSESAEPEIAITTSQRGPRVVVDVSSPDPMVSTDGGESFEPTTPGDPAGDLGFGRYLVATLVEYYGGTVDVADQDDVLYTIELPQATHQ